MRLIDADKLEMHEQLKPLGNGNYEYVEVVYKDDIDDAPTIEPERHRGEWLEDGHERGFSECSKCGYIAVSVLSERHYNFCPNCGADMRINHE